MEQGYTRIQTPTGNTITLDVTCSDIVRTIWQSECHKPSNNWCSIVSTIKLTVVLDKLHIHWWNADNCEDHPTSIGLLLYWSTGLFVVVVCIS